MARGTKKSKQKKDGKKSEQKVPKTDPVPPADVTLRPSTTAAAQEHRRAWAHQQPSRLVTLRVRQVDFGSFHDFLVTLPKDATVHRLRCDISRFQHNGRVVCAVHPDDVILYRSNPVPSPDSLDDPPMPCELAIPQSDAFLPLSTVFPDLHNFNSSLEPSHTSLTQLSRAVDISAFPRACYPHPFTHLNDYATPIAPGEKQHMHVAARNIALLKSFQTKQSQGIVNWSGGTASVGGMLEPNALPVWYDVSERVAVGPGGASCALAMSECCRAKTAAPPPKPARLNAWGSPFSMAASGVSVPSLRALGANSTLFG
ncbi:hypothetical protein BJ742DRAFT_69431 [Cladochytrium replicatum]|nr:hypothetical protein BJ742DRAFT_69431 [Cladochytrium replicatum]